MFNCCSLHQLLVPTPEINLNTSDVYYIAGSSLVLICQMMLLSQNIDNDTVAAFVLKRNFDNALISYTNVSKFMDETKFIYTVTFNFLDLKLSDAEEYTCTGIIDDAVNSSFIIQSNEAADSGSIVIKSKRKSCNHFLFVSYLCLNIFPVPISQVLVLERKSI